MMKKSSLLLTAAIIILSTSEALAAKARPQYKNSFISQRKQPLIRVRVRKKLKNVLISGRDLKRKIHLNDSSKLFRGKKAVKFNCNGFGKRTFWKDALSVLLASLKSQTGLVTLDKEKYQGEILVVADHQDPAL